jgi:hypothetical protein
MVGAGHEVFLVYRCGEGAQLGRSRAELASVDVEVRHVSELIRLVLAS